MSHAVQLHITCGETFHNLESLSIHIHIANQPAEIANDTKSRTIATLVLCFSSQKPLYLNKRSRPLFLIPLLTALHK